MNALRHGLRARTVVLPDENREDFDQLHAALENQYQPQNQAERDLVDQAAVAQWKLVRAEKHEAACYHEEPTAKGRAAIFDRMTQVTCRLERSYFKAYKELDRIKAARAPQPEPSKQKKKDDEAPRNYQVSWVNSKTGEKDVFHRTVDGKSTNYQNGQPLTPDSQDG